MTGDSYPDAFPLSAGLRAAPSTGGTGGGRYGRGGGAPTAGAVGCVPLVRFAVTV
jgi:hypothetical protein